MPLPFDPIDEAPHATWYVRPGSGGQFGPAAGDIMRKWIGEGRVSAESMVWREGWTDWKLAGPLFHHQRAGEANLAPGAGMPPVPSSAAAFVAAGEDDHFIVLFDFALCHRFLLFSVLPDYRTSGAREMIFI